MFEDYTDDAAASLAANQNFKTCANAARSQTDRQGWIMRTIGVLVWVAGLFAVAGFALAARNVADSSRMKNREWGIVTCARVLQSSNETAKNRAIAYFNRAIACKADGDDGRAIADYTEAIRLDPKLAIAYYQRGIAYHALGDFDRAIADYTEAIRLDPKLGPKAATERAVYEKAAAQRVAEEAKRLVAQKAAAEEAAASSSKGATERVRAEKAVTEEAKRRAAQRQRDAAAKNAIHDVAEGPGPNNELATITKRGEQLQKLPIGNIFLAAPKTMKVNEVRSVEARVGINVPMEILRQQIPPRGAQTVEGSLRTSSEMIATLGGPGFPQLLPTSRLSQTGSRQFGNGMSKRCRMVTKS